MKYTIQCSNVHHFYKLCEVTLSEPVSNGYIAIKVSIRSPEIASWKCQQSHLLEGLTPDFEHSYNIEDGNPDSQRSQSTVS